MVRQECDGSGCLIAGCYCAVKTRRPELTRKKEDRPSPKDHDS